MNLKKIVKKLNFDPIDDDMFAEVFNEKQIVKDFTYENSIVTPLETLPEDYLWYLQNYGSRTVRNMEFQVSLKDETMCVVSFEGLVTPQRANQQYRYQTCTGSYKYRLAELSETETPLAATYLPISVEAQGKMLVLDLSDEKGSIWFFPSKTDCEKYDLSYEPNFVAKSLTEFLSLLKPSYTLKYALQDQGYKETEECSDVWKKNILSAKEVFYQLLANHENKTFVKHPAFKNENEFLKILLEQPEKITINEARAVELFYLSSSWKMKNEVEFLASIEKVHKLKAPLALPRENAKLSKLEQLTNAPNYIGTAHNLYKTVLSSTINGLQCKETFVLHKNENTQQFSFVKRILIEKEDMVLKGIGTFKFDQFGWISKEEKQIAWSEIPATLHLKQETFTEAYLTFIKNTIEDVSLQPKLEQFIYKHYLKIDYPEFLAMSDTDKEFFKSAYPKVTAPSEIWKLLEDDFEIHFEDAKTIHLQFQYLPDDEHGLTIAIENGNLKIL